MVKENGFSKDEISAMRERAKELKKEERENKSRSEGEKDVLEKISSMTEPDKSMAKKIHEIVKKTAPELMPKTWYGMPAYSNNDGNVVCFFQDAKKFKSRYATLGFSDKAKLDEKNMWPSSFAITKIGEEEEKKIVELIKKAVK